MSNILFRYATHPDTGETIPVEVKFIDFQAARFASLATDLVLFLFTSVQVNLLDTQVGLYPCNHDVIETEMGTHLFSDLLATSNAWRIGKLVLHNISGIS